MNVGNNVLGQDCPCSCPGEVGKGWNPAVCKVLVQRLLCALRMSFRPYWNRPL